MTIKELGMKLSEMYNNAPKRRCSCYDTFIRNKICEWDSMKDTWKRDIITQMGISTSYLNPYWWKA